MATMFSIRFPVPQTFKPSHNKASSPQRNQNSLRARVNQHSQVHNVVSHHTTAAASPEHHSGITPTSPPHQTGITPVSPEYRKGERALELLAQASRDAHLAPEAEELVSIPPKLEEMVRAFQAYDDRIVRYQHLLRYAHEMDPLPPEQCVPENRMRGCALQVWVVCRLGEDGRVYFQADSQSLLMKGLAAVLVAGLSGATPRGVMSVPAEFVQRLGFQESLTPSRRNGFQNLLKFMQKKTVEVCGESGEKS